MFTIETFQNKFLAPDQDRVDGILTVTAGQVAHVPSGELLVGFIIDVSGSMSGERIDAAKTAAIRAINRLDEAAWFFVVTFHTSTSVVCAPMRASLSNRTTAMNRIQWLSARGGTAMSRALAEARKLYHAHPDKIRQAIFLTDGKNESESVSDVEYELGRCAGVFQCDCWGIGTDWRVGEVQAIAKALLGKASLIAEASGIEAAFVASVGKAQSKSLADVRLRVWTPLGAEVAFCKQVNPTIEDLTGSAALLTGGDGSGPTTRDYLTGAWSAGESRDFHVAVKVKRGRVGDEMLAARPSVVYRIADGRGWVEEEVRPGTARLFANWTGDDALSSRLDQQVAHYTGQAELATAIQQGLELRELGDEARATHMLGRAVRLAHESENVEMTARLKKVVDIVDEASGTIRLKRQVTSAAQMELQLESSTTRRARRRGSGE